MCCLSRSGRLFQTVATRVGEHFGYGYPLKDDRRVSAHLVSVRNMSPDALEIT